MWSIKHYHSYFHLLYQNFQQIEEYHLKTAYIQFKQYAKSGLIGAETSPYVDAEHAAFRNGF